MSNGLPILHSVLIFTFEMDHTEMSVVARPARSKSPALRAHCNGNGNTSKRKGKIKCKELAVGNLETVAASSLQIDRSFIFKGQKILSLKLYK